MSGIRQLFTATVLGLFLMPALIGLSHVSANEATSPERATRFIDDIGSRAIRVLADHALAQPTKEQKIKALLIEGLDLPTIGRFALGRAWQTASDAQRDEYSRLFRDYVVDTYARRLAVYSGETFKITGAQPIADTDAIVMTVIERPSGPPVNTGWRVRAEEGGYKVVDVVVEGVSMALTQRQEFASVVQNKGFGGLIESLRTLNQQFATNAPGAAAVSQ